MRVAAPVGSRGLGAGGPRKYRRCADLWPSVLRRCGRIRLSSRFPIRRRAQPLSARLRPSPAAGRRAGPRRREAGIGPSADATDAPAGGSAAGSAAPTAATRVMARRIHSGRRNDRPPRFPFLPQAGDADSQAEIDPTFPAQTDLELGKPAVVRRAIERDFAHSAAQNRPIVKQARYDVERHDVDD